MQYFFIALLVGLITMFVGLTIIYAMSAMAHYSKQAACHDYKDAKGDAFPYEASLAFVLWMATFPILGSEPLPPVSEWHYVVIALLLFGLSFFLVHVMCVKLGKKFPTLYKISWLG